MAFGVRPTMRCLIVVVLVCLHLIVVHASSDTCNAGCTCGEEDKGDSNLSKVEGMAAAVGALTPLAIGSAGLAIFKMIKGPSLPGSGAGTPDVSSPTSPKFPRTPGSDSPFSYHNTRRGSTPVSMFGEDDEISFDESWRGPRPDTSSTHTNIHRPSKGDAVNSWM